MHAIARSHGLIAKPTGLSISVALLASAIPVVTGCMQSGQGPSGSGWGMPAIFAAHKAEAEGEAWTILCLEARDLNRVKNCDVLVDALRRVNGLDASQASVAHAEGVSSVFYGTYHRTIDAASGKERFDGNLLGDLRLVRSLAAGQTFPFTEARPVPKPTPNPGRPEWQISNCPGTYTLQIGVFYNTATFDKRKDSAAEWAEKLRAEGIEAYYHHGEVRSSVTVGHFEERDVLREQVGPKSSTTGTVIRYSERVEAYRRQDRFHYNLENGYKVKRIRDTSQGPREFYQESFLITVPRPERKPSDIY
jgi:hypothetical protein